MTIDKKEAWANLALSLMRGWLPRAQGIAFTCDHFAAKMFDRYNLEAPADRRWMGTVFQRAKREGLIEVLRINGVPATALTPGKHRTPLWVAKRK